MPTQARKKHKSKIKKRSPKAILNLYSYNVPNVVIVGDPLLRAKLKNIEKNFNLTLLFTTPEKLQDVVNKRTIAIILDEKALKTQPTAFIDRCLSLYQFLPLFYLSRKVRPDNFYMRLYEKGVHGVLRWPQEASILHDLIIESLKPHPHATGKSKADKKLSDLVKSHLILNGNYKSLKVKVIEGFVFLKGKVKSIHDKLNIEKEVSRLLGVKKVVLKDLGIKSISKTTDKELERKIKMYISNILGDKKHSLSVKVKDKVATLMGVAARHGDVHDIENFINKQPGVKKLKRQIKYQPQTVSKNIKKAKFLEIKVKNMFDGVKFVSINIYGEYVEVSGTVRLNTDRILVEKYLLQVLPVKKVVNKLFVTQSRK